MELDKLKTGRRYWVTHERKGEFDAVVVGYADTPIGDAQDDFFITMDINTSDDGAPWIRRDKLSNVTQTNIRPSLIKKIKPYEPRLIKKKGVRPEDQKESLGDKLKRKLGF